MGFLGNHLKIARGNSFFFYKFSFYYISSSWYYNVNSKSKERENPPIIILFAHGFVFPKAPVSWAFRDGGDGSRVSGK